MVDNDREMDKVITGGFNQIFQKFFKFYCEFKSMFYNRLFFFFFKLEEIPLLHLITSDNIARSQKRLSLLGINQD